MHRLALAAALVITHGASATPAAYQFDPTHTSIEFHIEHLGFSFKNGRFDRFTGSFEFDPADPSRSSVQIRIPVDSIDTDVPALDEHLQKPDFFDVGKYPSIDFRSTQVTTLDDKRLRVTGNLTLHGVTKPVSLDVTINKIGPHPFTQSPAVGFSARTALKRSDFGMDTMLGMIGDEVEVRIETEAQQQAVQ